MYKTNFLRKSRVCNSTYDNLIRVLWALCTLSAHSLLWCTFQTIILKTVGRVAETRTLICHVYKTNFLSKSRVYDSNNNYSIRGLWPSCTCSVYILTIVQVLNHYLEPWILYQTNFPSKSRVCKSTNNNLIRVLWPFCTCSVIILTTMEVLNHYLGKCRRSCGDTNPAMPCI